MSKPQGGQKLKLYVSSAAEGAAAVWVLAKGARDITRPDSDEALDASARYSETKRYVPGMKEGGLEFEYIKRRGTTDTVFTQIQTALRSNLTLNVALADGAIATTGTVYHRDWYMVEKCEEIAELGGVHRYAISLKPTPVFDGSDNLIEEEYVTVT